MKKNGLEFAENLSPDDGRIGYKMIGNLKEINDAIDRFWEKRGQKKMTLREIIRSSAWEKNKRKLIKIEDEDNDFYEL